MRAKKPYPVWEEGFLHELILFYLFSSVFCFFLSASLSRAVFFLVTV